MGHEILNRNGMPSNRNLAKPFKPPRIIKDTNKYHPMDYMKLTSTGKNTISNGSFGQKVTGNVTNHASIVKHTPGRARPGRKSKNVSRMFPGNQHKQFEEKSRIQLLQLRNDLLSYKWICEYSGKANLFHKKLNYALQTLNEYIKTVYDNQELKDIYHKDWVRRKTLLGRIAKGSIDIAPIKSVNQRIAKAMTIINFAGKRKEVNVVNKLE